MRRLLFISAPFGRFFAEAAKELEDAGCEVYRLCFEGGDWMETPARNRVVYSGSLDGLAQFAGEFIRSKAIDGVVSFNDVLERNRTIMTVAAQCGVKRYVIENGYLRPHWVTLELDGVNAFSHMPRDTDFYRQIARQPEQLGSAIEPKSFVHVLSYHVRSTISHFISAVALSPFFRFNQKYYGDSVTRQMIGYTKEFILRHTYSEQKEAEEVLKAHEAGDRKIFTVLMQKPGDGQLIYHSPYGGNRKFIREVISSFAKFAPQNAFLIVKQHPLDYGVERCPRYARKLIKAYGLQDRAIYLRKTSIDICMDYSAGVVTVNSTGGLQALQKGLAVKCMGQAVYDFEGLTFRGSLDEFWSKGQGADPEVLAGFIHYLRHTSQLNGGFHSKEARAILMPNIRRKLLVELGIQDGVRTESQRDMRSRVNVRSEQPVAFGIAAE
jgi:capsular polysaccharide export protein